MIASVLAADRVTVKLAATVPVFPSVTVTSLIPQRRGYGGAQSPLLSSTATVPSTQEVIVACDRHVRSAVAVEVAGDYHVRVAVGLPTDFDVLDFLNVPPPEPRNTLPA